MVEYSVVSWYIAGSYLLITLTLLGIKPTHPCGILVGYLWDTCERVHGSSWEFMGVHVEIVLLLNIAHEMEWLTHTSG